MNTASAHNSTGSTGGDPLVSFDLDSLVTGAARLRAERRALSDSTGMTLTWSQLDQCATRLAAQLIDLGFAAGECVMIAGGARASSVLTMIAAVRAGLDVALAPPHLSENTLKDFAMSCDAVALACETEYGELAIIEEMFAVAASTPSVRLVCSLGRGAPDGVVELDLGVDDARTLPPIQRAPGACRIFALSHGQIQRIHQHQIVAAAIELLSRAKIGMRAPIFTTLAPVSFAALAAGPFAALLAGCPLHFHGPFDAARFVAEFDNSAPAHLVAPRALADALVQSEAGGAKSFSSWMLIDNGRAGTTIPGSADAPFINLDELQSA